MVFATEEAERLPVLGFQGESRKVAKVVEDEGFDLADQPWGFVRRVRCRQVTTPRLALIARAAGPCTGGRGRDGARVAAQDADLVREGAKISHKYAMPPVGEGDGRKNPA